MLLFLDFTAVAQFLVVEGGGMFVSTILIYAIIFPLFFIIGGDLDLFDKEFLLGGDMYYQFTLYLEDNTLEGVGSLG